VTEPAVSLVAALNGFRSIHWSIERQLARSKRIHSGVEVGGLANLVHFGKDDWNSLLSAEAWLLVTRSSSLRWPALLRG